MNKKLATLCLVCAAALSAVLVTQALANGRTNQTPQPEDLPKAVAQLRERVDELERQLKADQKERAKQAEAMKEVDKNMTAVIQRMETLEHKEMANLKRDMAALGRSIDDLNTRVRRLE